MAKRYVTRSINLEDFLEDAWLRYKAAHPTASFNGLGVKLLADFFLAHPINGQPIIEIPTPAPHSSACKPMYVPDTTEYPSVKRNLKPMDTMLPDRGSPETTVQEPARPITFKVTTPHTRLTPRAIPPLPPLSSMAKPEKLDHIPPVLTNGVEKEMTYEEFEAIHHTK
jgi:hypothetical protein